MSSAKTENVHHADAEQTTGSDFVYYRLIIRYSRRGNGTRKPRQRKVIDLYTVSLFRGAELLWEEDIVTHSIHLFEKLKSLNLDKNSMITIIACWRQKYAFYNAEILWNTLLINGYSAALVNVSLPTILMLDKATEVSP